MLCVSFTPKKNKHWRVVQNRFKINKIEKLKFISKTLNNKNSGKCYIGCELKEAKMYSLTKSAKQGQEPIEVDIHFQETLTRENVAYIAVELIKNLIFQRHQLPMPYDAVKREVQRFTVDFSKPQDLEMMEVDR